MPKSNKKLAITKPEPVDPIERMDESDFTFCMMRALNKSDTAAYQEAYGGTKENAASNAWRKASRSDIIEVTNKLRKRMAEERVQSAIITKEEILGFCARAIRTPVSELTEHDPLVTEVRTEVSPMGAVKKTLKKANPLDAAKVALTVLGVNDGGAPATISQILINITNQGIPEERDVTPIEQQ
jgi:hypothetical protein